MAKSKCLMSAEEIFLVRRAEAAKKQATVSMARLFPLIGIDHSVGASITACQVLFMQEEARRMVNMFMPPSTAICNPSRPCRHVDSTVVEPKQLMAGRE